MGMLRQMKRNILRSSDRIAMEKSREAERQMNEVPDKCTTCQEKLDVKNQEHLDTWIVVHTKKNETQLFCKTCYEVKKNG